MSSWGLVCYACRPFLSSLRCKPYLSEVAQIGGDLCPITGFRRLKDKATLHVLIRVSVVKCFKSMERGKDRDGLLNDLRILPLDKNVRYMKI